MFDEKFNVLLEADDEDKKDDEKDEEKKDDEKEEDKKDDEKDDKDDDDDTDPEESDEYNDIMSDDDDFDSDDFTGDDDDDEPSDDGEDDYNAVIMVSGDQPSGDLGSEGSDDVYAHMAKLGYLFTVISNNMKHIHLNTTGRKFEEIHNQAEEYYRHFGYRCDDFFELAKQSASIELDNPGRSKEHIEDVEVETEKDYPFELAVSRMHDNLSKAIDYLKKARQFAGDRTDIESMIDDELGYLNKQVNFILRSKMAVTESVDYNSLL